MTKKYLLCLGAERLVALLWRNGALEEEDCFPPDAAGLAAFAEYLARRRGQDFYLLADSTGEAYRIETLPRAHGADRAALLRRKLDQHYPGAALAAAISCGRVVRNEKDSRRDEQFLLAALLEPQSLAPWLAALRAAEARLAGIWPLPLLGGALLAALPAAGAHCLLVSLSASGMRQSFFAQGRLVFSRLLPAETTRVDELAAHCATEAGNIRQYLLGQRLLPRGATMSVVVLAHPAQIGAFEKHCGQNAEGMQIHYQDLHAAAGLIGLKTLPPDSRSESLFLHLLARKPPREQLAPPGERRFFRLRQARAWLFGSGVCALLACLVFAGWEMNGALASRATTEALLQQADGDMRHYQEILKTFPPLPVSAEVLRATVDRFDALEKRSPPPEPLYFAVSRALEAAPRINLERIEWQLSGNPADSLKPASAPSVGAVPIYEIAIVHGALPAAMAADQRGQLETVNAFVAALRGNPGLRVSVQRMPFEVESDRPLRSANAPAQAAPLPFILHLSRER
ncbi:MAG: hypothetical protein LBE33_02025 [Zoogloeaceae bacterium]|jgi:hypothetical protein|nr:hypothetical protein [Zoogloeaceae bacterium]